MGSKGTTAARSTLAHTFPGQLEHSTPQILLGVSGPGLRATAALSPPLETRLGLGERVKSILPNKLRSRQYARSRLLPDELDRGRLLVRLCLGEMFRLAKFDSVLPEFPPLDLARRDARGLPSSPRMGVGGRNGRFLGRLSCAPPVSCVPVMESACWWHYSLPPIHSDTTQSADKAWPNLPDLSQAQERNQLAF